MIISKKSLMLSSVALLGAVGFASAECSNCAELDIIVRDFESTHPDFENFTEEYSNGKKRSSWTYDGYADNDEWKKKRKDDEYGCANESNSDLGVAIGEDMYPKSFKNSQLPDYLQKKKSSEADVKYGEFNCSKGIQRGYKHELEAKGCSEAWSQKVYITPGMVKKRLKFDKSKGEDMMYEPTIEKARTACDNSYFDQWYSDSDKSKRTNTVLQLELINPEEKIYEIDYNWNNGGYFPLDKVDGSGKRVGELEDSKQFGPQSLSIFCPPYDYEYAESQKDFNDQSTAQLCRDWLKYGGPRVPEAAKKAAEKNGSLGMKHLRNYSLTMMGYAKFKFHKENNEVFEFVGDDDMWIYVDGVLAVDLGGTHLAAPGKVEINYLAENKHGCHDGDPLAESTGSGENCDLTESGEWKDGTWHHLHFFYADRQTDGSNMKIHSTLSELAPSRYGQPAIGEATVFNEDGTWVVNLSLNTSLHEETVKNIKDAAAMGADKAIKEGAFPIVVQRVVEDEDGSTHTEYFVYVVSNFEYGTETSDGVVYKMNGELHKVNKDGSISSEVTLPASGDQYSFNYPATPEMAAEDESLIFIKGVTDRSWIAKHPITGSSGLTVGGPTWGGAVLKVNMPDNFTAVDNEVNRPAFDINKMFSKRGGSAGEEIAKENMGELWVSGLPKEAGEDPDGVEKWLNKKSKENPSMTNQQYLASVNGSTDGNKKNFVCTVNDKGVESCPSIAFWTSRPFVVNVRVFDHLGHFIGQYTDGIDLDGMKKLAKNSGLTAGSSVCKDKLFSGVAVSLKLYPVSQNGRKLATGPYIYQVSLIKETWGSDSYCFYYGSGEVQITAEDYARSSFSKTLGYRRID